MRIELSFIVKKKDLKLIVLKNRKIVKIIDKYELYQKLKL